MIRCMMRNMNLKRSFIQYPRLYSVKFSISHEYVMVNSDSTITIGITLEGIALLGGSISSITLNILNGQKLLVGDTFGTITTAKKASALVMPVTGEIIDINKEVVDNPQDILKSPLVKGWLIKIKASPNIKEESKDLLSDIEYKTILSKLYPLLGDKMIEMQMLHKYSAAFEQKNSPFSPFNQKHESFLDKLNSLYIQSYLTLANVLQKRKKKD